MADNLIKPVEIPGGAVYGVAQHDYNVKDAGMRDYAMALSTAAFKQTLAIESTTSAYAAVVRQRQRKVEDLGVVLAYLTYAIDTMNPKSNDVDKKSDTCSQVYDAHEIAYRYGINIPYEGVSYSTTSGGKAYITYKNATRAQNDVQYALDMENNNLQQDLVSLQTFIAKRDNAFSTAAQIIKKASGTADSTISNVKG